MSLYRLLATLDEYRLLLSLGRVVRVWRDY